MLLLKPQLDHWAIRWKRTWRGSAITNFVLPVLYLLAMGVGLGGYVDEAGTGGALGGLTYLEFLAPGLLATTVMMNAVGASTWQVMAAIKWDKTYFAMLATPLRVVDILVGHLGLVAGRVALTAAVFLLVLALFGVVASPLAVLAVPAGVLVGMAYSTPCFALAAFIQRETGFMLLYRLGLIPMFLFSGAFFPIEQLPEALAWLARLVPLWHGVELVRGLVLGLVDPLRWLLHVGYLAAWVVGGFLLARASFQRRLVT